MNDKEKCKSRVVGADVDGKVKVSKRCLYPDGFCELGDVSKRCSYAAVLGGSTCKRMFPDKLPGLREN